MTRKSTIFSIAVICSTAIFNINAQFDISPEIPSHLPAPPPPKPVETHSPSAGGQGHGHVGGDAPLGVLQGQSVLPPPQNGLPVGPGPIPGQFVPFGLNHIILIVVPQFISRYLKFPDWMASSIRISMPITVFFDQLTVPPGMFLPGAVGVPGPIPPFGPLPSAGLSFSAQIGRRGGYGYLIHKPYSYGRMRDGDPEDPEETFDGFSEEEISIENKRRRRRAAGNERETRHIGSTQEYQFKIRKTRAVSMNRTVHKNDRATIFPKIAKILANAGLEGESCMLRTVCEVHEAPLKHYGLVGELITLFFSVSRSVFAESHIPEYLLAEEAGKAGDCTGFYQDCDKSLFSWEESIRLSNQNMIHDIPVSRLI